MGLFESENSVEYNCSKVCFLSINHMDVVYTD